MIYSATTNHIRIQVEVEYVPPEQHIESHNTHVWAYHITMDNHGPKVVRLRTRHWTIMDGKGRIQLVEGEGVVGEHPILRPKQSYSYSSGCPLPTPSGSMSGYYMFNSEDGETLKVDIPAFSLDLPQLRRILN
jgi:ApaG protein